MNIDHFLSQFSFKPELAGYIGIERERFLLDASGKIVPRAKDFLEAINDPKWTYELSACQIEDRTRPRKNLLGMWFELLRNDLSGRYIARSMGLKIQAFEAAPRGMPLDVYPAERYQKIVGRISRVQLEAACRVAGTHIHLGMSDIEEAIRSYNILREKLDFFCQIGDHSCGERLRLYKTMGVNWQPPIIESPSHFFKLAREQNFVEDPRSCYWLIRLSPHGTVELRMFGTAESRLEILRYVYAIRFILRNKGIELPPLDIHSGFRWG